MRIILCGCNGKMGQVVSLTCAAREDCTIVAGVDRQAASRFGYPVFPDYKSCGETADVIIDFSHPSALSGTMAYAKKHTLPAVIATTGFSDLQIEQLHTLSQSIPVFCSANMSLGISLLADLSRRAAAVLGDGFDIEIVEKHHNQKLDAPSGTALMLADAVQSRLPHPAHYVFDRHSRRQKRDPHEIGFSSIRGGTIVGEHEVIFAGHDEVITLSHTAASKEIFAVGAINAARFLTSCPPGWYEMSDLISSV